MGLTCILKGHDWDGCICRRCKKHRDREHKPVDEIIDLCDACNRYHYMDCGDCGGGTETRTYCAVCGESIHEWPQYMD